MHRGRGEADDYRCHQTRGGSLAAARGLGSRRIQECSAVAPNAETRERRAAHTRLAAACVEDITPAKRFSHRPPHHFNPVS